MLKKTSDNFEAKDDLKFTYNGRSALKILLKDYGAKKNDIVIAPLITWNQCMKQFPVLIVG